MCPHCGRDAPAVYRGALPVCSACGKLRAPTAGAAVALTGKPTKVGGSVARFVGWLTLAVGVFAALFVGALFQWIFTGGIVGFVLGGGILFLTALLSFGFLRGGRALQERGSKAEAQSFEQSVFGLAEARGGTLSMLDVAQTLGLNEVDADRLLTDLAKKNPERVRVEVDDAGTLIYQFPQLMLATANTVYSQRAVSIEDVEATSRAETLIAPTRRSGR